MKKNKNHQKNGNLLQRTHSTPLFTPSNSPEKPLYMRDLTNIYLLTFNNKQTKQREDNEHFTKVSHGPIWDFCITGHRREDQELG